MSHSEFFAFPIIPDDFDAVVGVMRDAFAPWADGLTLTYTQCAATHVRCELRADVTSAMLGAFEVWKDIEDGQPGITLRFEDPPPPKRRKATREEGDRMASLPTFEERAQAWSAHARHARAEQQARRKQQAAWWRDYVQGRMQDAYRRLGVFKVKEPARRLMQVVPCVALPVADTDRTCAQRLECAPYRYQRRQIDNAGHTGIVYDVVQDGVDIGQVYLWSKTPETTEVWVKSAPVDGTNDELRADELDAFAADVQRWFSTALAQRQRDSSKTQQNPTATSGDIELSENLRHAQLYLDTYQREKRQGLVSNQDDWMRRHAVIGDRTTLYRWVKRLKEMQQMLQQ